ncbi:MAG: hypothetical protein ACO3EK_20655, partial [Alphaproteobacteria bacterium]
MRLAAPFRGLAQRNAALGLVLLCAVLIVVGRAEPRLLERLRTLVLDVAGPVADAVSPPVVASQRVADRSAELLSLHSENAILRVE